LPRQGDPKEFGVREIIQVSPGLGVDSPQFYVEGAFPCTIRGSTEADTPQVRDMVEMIVVIGSSSDDIIMAIDGIAFQTNILALSAAVEGCACQEADAEFAVVADDVCARAQRAAHGGQRDCRRRLTIPSLSIPPPQLEQYSMVPQRTSCSRRTRRQNLYLLRKEVP